MFMSIRSINSYVNNLFFETWAQYYPDTIKRVSKRRFETMENIICLTVAITLRISIKVRFRKQRFENLNNENKYLLTRAW